MNNPEIKNHYELVFQTAEEKEAAMRRRKLIKETAPQERDSTGTADKVTGAVDKEINNDERRSSSNADQIGKAKGDRNKPTDNLDKDEKAQSIQHSEKEALKSDARNEKSSKSKKNVLNDSLAYSESEQLQFSNPPK